MKLDVVILAAGKGTRMHSARPKVLHELAGRSLLQHVIQSAEALHPRQIAVVVGHEADRVIADTQPRVEPEIIWVEQHEQLGTGHAVAHALPKLAGDGAVLVLYGDVPLVGTETLQACAEVAAQGSVGLVVSDFADPAQLGRIVRDDSGSVVRIVEFKDADDDLRQIREINSGIVAVQADKLSTWIARLDSNNAQGELYLTDIIEMAVTDGVPVEPINAPESEVTGVNDRMQLAGLERVYQQTQAERLMAAGVTVADPSRLDIRGTVTAGQDCYLDINVVLQGDVVLGSGVCIGPGCVVINSVLGDDVEVQAHSVVEGAIVERDCAIGPFARVRPGTEMAPGVRIGNFVETKKAKLGAGTKASHLTYLGDTELGADCNVGAGTVTCNYDGINKHRTEIGDNVFVGTNSTLVAPVDIGDGAFVAAGSVVTNKVPDGELAVGRGKQRNIKGWTRPDQRSKKS